jgi:hypothetical protein
MAPLAYAGSYGSMASRATFAHGVVMRSASLLWAGLWLGLAACGGETLSGSASGLGSGSDSGSRSGTDSGTSRPDSASAVDSGRTYSGTYSGSIVADVVPPSTTDSSSEGVLLAAFENGPLPSWSDLLGWGCGTADSMTAGSCCVRQLGPPPDPLPGPFPKAGDVTIELGGKLLATLDPVVTGEEYGFYGQDAPVSFSTGDALAVAGSGSGLVAPFTRTLEVPASLTGMVPVLGKSPITVDRSLAFQFQWTPEGKDGEVLELSFDGGDASGSYALGCHVPDAAGSVVVDASLLAVLPAGTAGVSALRIIPRTASGANVQVALIGEALIYGTATLE